MADLLPSLSSDDDEAVNSAAVAGSRVSSNRAVTDSDSDDESDEDMALEFGGILGEDGGIPATTTTSSIFASQQKKNGGWSYAEAMESIQNSGNNKSTVDRMDVADLIAAKRKTLNNTSASDKQENDNDDDSNSSSGSESDDDDDDSDSEVEEVDDAKRTFQEDEIKVRTGADEPQNDETNDDEEEDEEHVEEQRKADDYFETVDASGGSNNNNAVIDDEKMESFSQLALCRPLLRGVATMGFVTPTPVQSRVIPIGLTGRDICASAVTGSGKTAAFLLPIAERMMHRHLNTTKAIVLAPTRELAAQCYGMWMTLAQFTKLRAVLIVGGTKNVNAQAAELRTRPDLIIATPGRILDHVTNSSGASLGDIEFLVLDEADRLMDLGFQDEIMELVKSCPVKRQTMLFSATMNTKVDDLIKLSLKNPVRARISDKAGKKNNGKIEIAPRLEQEFVRVRASNEGVNREGMLLALLTRTFKTNVIVFFDTKVTAHRVMILCGLCGIRCAELHGNLTQTQRLAALEDFRNDEVDVLLATDLAARGLDISHVKTVINFEMPSQIESYVHRIGRTGRAGRAGRSCTLIGEGRRHLMKDVIRDATSKKNNKTHGSVKNKNNDAVIRSRNIPNAVVNHFAAKIQTLEPHVDEVLQAETVAKMDRLAEMEVVKAQNLIEHADEIEARPKREWFATKEEKQNTKEEVAERRRMIAEKAGTGVHRMTRKKRRAREVLEAMNAANEEDNYDDGKNSKTSIQASVAVKSEVRKQKREQAELDREFKLKSTHDLDMEDKRRDDKRAKKKAKKSKSSNENDNGGMASGDGSLFAEERVSFSKKQSAKEAETAEAAVKSSYQFRGETGRKLGKKKGHHKFKSKQKYKRR